MLNFFNKQEHTPTTKGFIGVIALAAVNAPLGYAIGLLTSL